MVKNKIEDTKTVVDNKKKINKKVIWCIIAGIILVLAVICVFIFTKDEKIVGSDLSKKKYTLEETKVSKLKLVDYDGGNFTMKIPEGWKVTTAGTEMYYAISVKDPNDSRNQIFAVLKAGPLLKSKAAKNWHAWYVSTTGNQMYKMFSEAVILNPATAQNFYENFNEYTDYAKKFEPTYSSFDFPFISLFKKVEQFEANTYMKSVSKDDKTIRATFEDANGKAGEGLFMATIVDAGSAYAGSVDTAFYSAYNVIFVTSAKDEFIDYQDILCRSLNTLEYKQSFVNATNVSITERTQAALKANATIQAAFDSYNSAWTARQKTYDITSQKYSDATLGYERIYDTETGEIYKAYNGFTDDYSGERYKTITDNMYSEKISGYIDKIN